MSDEILAPHGDNAAPGTPQPVGRGRKGRGELAVSGYLRETPTREPLYPGRMASPNSRVYTLLRRANLVATDIPPGPDGNPWVTMAEVEAEIARLGKVVYLPDPLPPLTETEALRLVKLLHLLGAHLIKLHPGRKAPVELAWQDQPALTEAEAVAWLVAGGNIGINLLRSGAHGATGWLVLDAENQAAADFLIAAGFVPTARTANSKDEFSPKFGGCHFWLPLPAGIDPAELKSTLQLPLEGGGLLDLLVGARYVVGPGSRLDSAPGVRYDFDSNWLAGMEADPVWASAMAAVGVLEAGE